MARRNGEQSAQFAEMPCAANVKESTEVQTEMTSFYIRKLIKFV